MPYRIAVAPKAREDLLAINAYICEELNNPDAAKKLMREMKAKIASLSEMPERGTTLDSVIPLKTGFRFLVCGSYKIFYVCSREQVDVLRILNDRQNYMKALF